MSEHSPAPGKTPDQARRAGQAQVRQGHRAGRTTAEQFGLLETRPGKSTRERARLERSINDEDTADNVGVSPDGGDGGDKLPPRKRAHKKEERR